MWRLARRFGYQTQEGAQTEEGFLVNVQACTAWVHALYQHLVQELRDLTTQASEGISLYKGVIWVNGP
jgi:hypothetical protein